MSKLHIEIYSDAYKDEVASLILHIQNSEFDIPISLAMQPDLGNISGFYQTNNGNFWIARIGTEIIGTIALLDIGDHKAALRKMFVGKQYRGKEQGIGQKLLDMLLDWARQKGFKEIFLGTTATFTRAQRFYEKNGFTVTEKQALPKTFPIMEVDSKFYRYTL